MLGQSEIMTIAEQPLSPMAILVLAAIFIVLFIAYILIVEQNRAYLRKLEQIKKHAQEEKRKVKNKKKP